MPGMPAVLVGTVVAPPADEMSTPSTMDREISSFDRTRDAIGRGLPWLTAAVVGLFLLWWLIGRLEPSLYRSRIRVGVVERASLEAVLTAAGTVEPSRDQVISSRVEGRVLRVVSQPGTLLEVGDPVLELDVGQAALEVGRLESERQQRRSERLELELRLEERLIELRSQLALRELDIEEQGYRVEQDERLFEEGLIPETELRASVVRKKKSEIELDKVRESVGNSRKSLAAQIASLDAQLETLNRELEDARQRAAMAVTRADRAGVLTFVVADVGATVRPGDVLARIADPDRFRVEATISDVHAPRLREAQPVRVPIAEEQLAGTISRILPVIEEGALRFWVELEEPSHRLLRSNMRTDVLVVVDYRESALRVPKGPSTNSSGLQRVFVLDGEGKAVRRDVRLGLSGYKHYEVLEGLEEGDQVILSDMTRYMDMEAIKVRG